MDRASAKNIFSTFSKHTHCTTLRLVIAKVFLSSWRYSFSMWASRCSSSIWFYFLPPRCQTKRPSRSLWGWCTLMISAVISSQRCLNCSSDLYVEVRYNNNLHSHLLSDVSTRYAPH
jgi:hypothetical protein